MILAVACLGAVGMTATGAVAASNAKTQALLASFPKRVYYTQFNSALKKHTWTKYTGTPSCCKTSSWSPSQVVVQHGALRIRTSLMSGKWVSGGVSMANIVNQKYGRWTIRFRMPKGVGTGMDVALRPNGNGTVVDWAEQSSIYGASRNTETATLHYSGGRVHAKVSGKFNQWHTMRIDWTPTHISVFKDGKRWAYYTKNLPTEPMHLVMQTNTGTNGFSGVDPNGSTPHRVALQVDYVSVRSYK
jgi:beta-glucanase (GH16 family)